ncbi:MAG: ubiquinol-cytochrome c reductase iron-sulfur subunit [Planctomycetota bacterium]
MSESRRQPGTPPATRRRSALAIITGMLIGMGTGLATLILGFVSNALGRKRDAPWIRVGSAEDLSPETFQKIVLSVEKTHAWIEKAVPVTIYAKDLYPEDPIAFLSVCSHLGCSVKWVEESKHFACPCHGGVYDEHGEVVAGPPPRALTRLETKVEQEVFFARMADPGQET